MHVNYVTYIQSHSIHRRYGKQNISVNYQLLVFINDILHILNRRDGSLYNLRKGNDGVYRKYRLTPCSYEKATVVWSKLILTFSNRLNSIEQLA